ncbi:MAG: sucrase ferredoxin, partial [Gaiellaceae bacterium]
VDGSTLSGPLKAHLVAERLRLPRARILFIRSTDRRSRDGLLAYVAVSNPERRGLRRLELEGHDDLIGVDFATAGDPVDQPLFLVCTHGKHDRCCAKFGRPLYDAVREQVEDEWVWQSSHVGGDRFAGNLVVLADGVYYGRVEPAEAWPVVEAALERRIHLPLYRGRSCYGFAAQAAEIGVRGATGLLGVDEVRVRSLAPEGDGWRAGVEASGTAYEVDIRVEEGAPNHLTCSTRRLSRPKAYVAGSPRARGA